MKRQPVCPTCKHRARAHRHIETSADGSSEWQTLWSAYHSADDRSRGVLGFHAGYVKSTERCLDPFHSETGER